MHHPQSCSCPLHANQATALAQKARLLWISIILIGGFALAELGMGLYSHSLALLADSEHLISDGLALGLALLATWMAQFPLSDRATFGHRRVEVLAALANGVGLVAIALWIGWEAIQRLSAPPTEILSLPMLATALAGLVVNGCNVLLLHPHSHHDLNLRGAFLHMLADLLGSLGVILAAILVWQFHWLWADGAISVIVSGVIILGAVPLLSQSLNILLERTPSYLDIQQIRDYLLAHPSVLAIDQLRVWTIAPGQDVLWANLIFRKSDQASTQDILQTTLLLESSLQEKFGIQDVLLRGTIGPLTSPLNPDRLESLIANTSNNS